MMDAARRGGVCVCVCVGKASKTSLIELPRVRQPVSIMYKRRDV